MTTIKTTTWRRAARIATIASLLGAALTAAGPSSTGTTLAPGADLAPLASTTTATADVLLPGLPGADGAH